MAIIERSGILIKKEDGNEIWYYPVTRTQDIISGDIQLDEELSSIANQISNIIAGSVFETALNASSTKAVQNKVIYSALSGKVDKVSGKGLSTNDFTNALLEKLNGIATGANKTVVDSTLNDTSTNPVQNKIITAALDEKVDLVEGMGLSANDFTDELLAKLNGIATGATKVVVDSSLSSTSANAIQNKAVYNALAGKVDVVSGKSLSTNDFTDALKNKLEGIAAGATSVTIDTALSSTSTNPVQNKVVYTQLNRKVDKVDGMGLSANDFTDELLAKLEGIATGANKTVVDSSLNTTSTNPVQNKVINTALSGKVDKVDGMGLSSNDFTSALLEKLNGIAVGATKVTVDSSLSSTSANAIQNKAVYNALAGKVDVVSGKSLSTNDFTDDLLAKLEGIATGANKTVIDTALDASSENPVQNKVINTALSNKVDKVSGKGLSTNDFTSALLTKLNGIATGANKTVIDTALDASSANPVQNKVINTALSNKVDKVSGKGLSTNDFTTELLTKLNGIATGATKVIVDTALSSTSTNPVQNKIVQAAINELTTKVNNMITDAPEAYDTFKEISEYIASHETEYSALLAVSNNKVDKVSGKGLSTNDFTDELLAKLEGIASDATKVTIDSALSSTSTNPVQNKVINTALSGKVDKVSGKGLSTNDFTDDLLTKLNGIADGANKTVIDTALDASSTNPVQNKVINTALSGKVDKVSGKGLSTNDFTTDLLTKLNGIADGATKVTVDSSLSSTSTNTIQNKVVYSALSNKVDKVDGMGLSSNDFTTDLLTKLNGIATGANKTVVDSSISSTSTNPVQNKVVYTQLNGKVDKVDGMGLSANDFTDTLLTKLNGIATGATKVVVDSSLSSSSANAIQNKAVYNALAGKVDVVSGKGLSTNDFTDDLLTKLNGIATGATKYTHPTFTSRTSGLYKITVNSNGHVSAATAATGSDIKSLLAFDMSIAETAPTSVVVDTYFMEIEAIETV